MRISTNQIFDAGLSGVLRGQEALFKTQNQLSTGRRVLTPADDPAAASQALVVGQSQAVNTQQIDNQGAARSQLGLVDNQLSSLVDLLQSVRDRVVQAGNPALSPTDRQAIATELQSRLDEMTGIANAQDGNGQYLFSGYQSATQPFALGATGSMTYFGDSGERLLQVSASRQMAVNVAGNDVFMTVKSGNGTFSTAAGGNVAGGNNQGAGMIDRGAVLDPSKWSAAMAAGTQNLAIKFTVTTSGGTTTTTYQLYDQADLAANGNAATPLTAAATFVPGQAIPLTTTTPAVDYGAQVVITGQPSNGDTFDVSPSGNQSLFATIQNVISTLTAPSGTAGFTNAEYANRLGAQLTNIDQGLDNVSRVRSNVGARLNELDSLTNTAQNLDLQYQSTLSNLQDLDYAKAASDLSRQQMQLQAAMQSFVKVSGLSLFNLL